MFKLFRKFKRRKIVAKPFPPEWLEIIEKNIEYFQYLDQNQREALKNQVKVFLAEKAFEGAGGLVITDEIRVTIAAQACILTLGLKNDCYPLLDSVVVYPSAYQARVVKDRGGFPIESVETRIGESWELGTVVLSWDHSKGGGVDFNDGHNVVLHEFAHQLDSESGDTSGSPVLPKGSCYSTWAQVLEKEYKQLTRAFMGKQKTLIKKYGASHPAEFFAVVTETFFERPRKLKEKHPELYEQFVCLYGQDPLIQRERAKQTDA